MDLFSRPDDVPTRDNFSAAPPSSRGVFNHANALSHANPFTNANNSRRPQNYAAMTTGNAGIVSSSGVSSGGVSSGGVARTPGASWSVMPESLTFEMVGEEMSFNAKKFVKIVNMGAEPLR